nr:hypothetical protein [Desulfitobacterium hafniense]
MDEKIMEMFAQLLQEIQELKTGQDELRTGQKQLTTNYEELRTGQKQLTTNYEELRTGQEAISRQIVDLEHRMTDKFGGIYDFRQMQKEHNQKTDETLERIEKKVE